LPKGFVIQENLDYRAESKDGTSGGQWRDSFRNQRCGIYVAAERERACAVDASIFSCAMRIHSRDIATAQSRVHINWTVRGARFIGADEKFSFDTRDTYIQGRKCGVRHDAGAFGDNSAGAHLQLPLAGYKPRLYDRVLDILGFRLF